MVNQKIPLIDVPTKRVEDMKTSEIIDELDTDLSSIRLTELEEELMKRYPFSYYFKTKLECIEQDIEFLNRLLRHDHKDGQIMIPL